MPRLKDVDGREGLVFDKRYAWATRWGAQSQIIEARAYLDSALVSTVLQENETGTLFTYSNPRDTILPFIDMPDYALEEASGLSFLSHNIRSFGYAAACEPNNRPWWVAKSCGILPPGLG